MFARSSLVFAALIAVALAEIVEITKCDNFSDDICKVNEVRINPCKNHKVCKFKKGTSPSISFDYTFKDSAEKLKTGLFWVSPGGDVPFSDLKDADACPFTTCPAEANNKQELNYGLKLSKKLPNGVFVFKWLLWNENNSTQACCFKTTVELRK